MTNTLNNDFPAFNFTSEVQVEMVLAVMESRNLFMSAERFNKLAWELLG